MSSFKHQFLQISPGLWCTENVSKAFGPREIGPRKFVPKNICPRKFDPKEICPKGNLTQEKAKLQKFDPKKFDPMTIEPKGNLSQGKFVPKEI